MRGFGGPELAKLFDPFLLFDDFSNTDPDAYSAGFPQHPHRGIETVTYILKGEVRHKDSMGNGSVLRPGQIQLMSAGTGVTHSEFNPDRKAPGHFLQIWIQPSERGIAPSYTEWHPAGESAAKVLVISPDGRDRSATIHQDASVWRIQLQPGESTTHELADGRGVWVQVMRGALTMGDASLAAGDAASTETPGTFTLTATEATEALLFDLR